MSVAAIIPAAGMGSRMKGKIEKQFMPLAGKPLIVYVLQLLDNHPRINRIILALSRSRMKTIEVDILKPYGIRKVDRITEGGHDRCYSVQNAFRELRATDDIVLVHDAVRPFVESSQIDAVINAAAEHGAACLAVPVNSTIKRARGDQAFETVNRKELWAIQTPQTFRKEILGEALSHAEKTGDFGTDECYIVERINKTIKLVKGTEKNIKITRPEDWKLAESILNHSVKGIRVGTGYDAHRFAEGRKLVLGGVEIDCKKGLLGHSDADVVCHAIGDALLGAMGQGDLGRHFPSTDEKYKGISSLELLASIGDLLHKNHYQISNIDATVVAQAPKLSPFIGEMRKKIAGALHIEWPSISVKATTTEGLGFEGKEEGISAQAIVSIFPVQY